MDQEQKRIMFEALCAALEKCGSVTVDITSERRINVYDIKWFVDYLRTIKGIPTETFVNIATVLEDPHQYLTDKQAELLKVHRNAKTSRAIRNVLRRYIDFDRDVSRMQYARFADAINPYKRVDSYVVSNMGVNEYGGKTIRVETPKGKVWFEVWW